MKGDRFVLSVTRFAWLFTAYCSALTHAYNYQPTVLHAYSRRNFGNVLDESQLRGPRDFDPFRPVRYPSLATSAYVNSVRTLPDSYLTGVNNNYVDQTPVQYPPYSSVTAAQYNYPEFSRTYHATGPFASPYAAQTPLPANNPPPVHRYPLTNSIAFLKNTHEIAECEPGGVPKWDVLIMVDSSWSVGQVNFELIREFLRGVIEQLPSGTHLALVQFSDWARTEFSFDHFRKANEALDHLNVMQYMGGGTRVGNALDYVIKEELQYAKGDRPDIANAVVVITDGKSEDSIIPSATFLRNQGVKMVAVGVTEAVDDAQLLQIAGSPNHIFKLPSFKFFNDAFKKVLLAQLCVRPFVRRRSSKYSDHPYYDQQPDSFLPRIGSQFPPADIYVPTVARCREWDLTVVFDGIVVPQSEFEHVRHFIVSLLLQLPDTARLNFVNYKSNFDINTEILFRDFRTKQDIVDTLNFLTYKEDQQVRLGAALEEVLYSKHVSDRKHAADAMILITNGASFDDPAPAAEQLRQKGFKSIVIGIGQKVDPNELNIIAGHVSRVYRLPYFHNLNYHERRIIAEQLCVQEPDQPTNGIQYGNVPVLPIFPHIGRNFLPTVELNSIVQPPLDSSDLDVPPPAVDGRIFRFPNLDRRSFGPLPVPPPFNPPFSPPQQPLSLTTRGRKFQPQTRLPDSTLFDTEFRSQTNIPSRSDLGLSQTNNSFQPAPRPGSRSRRITLPSPFPGPGRVPPSSPAGRTRSKQPTQPAAKPVDFSPVQKPSVAASAPLDKDELAAFFKHASKNKTIGRSNFLGVTNITRIDEQKFNVPGFAVPKLNSLNAIPPIAQIEISSGKNGTHVGLKSRVPNTSPASTASDSRSTNRPITKPAPKKGGIFAWNGKKYESLLNGKSSSSRNILPSNNLFVNRVVHQSSYPDLSRDHPYCCGWAANNECQLNTKWMLKNCPGSCNNANGCINLACEDKQLDCEILASRGDCASRPHFMQYVCRASCSAC